MKSLFSSYSIPHFSRLSFHYSLGLPRKETELIRPGICSGQERGLIPQTVAGNRAYHFRNTRENWVQAFPEIVVPRACTHSSSFWNGELWFVVLSMMTGFVQLMENLESHAFKNLIFQAWKVMEFN